MRSVLISDFGGVLTTPLLAGFLAYQEESGVSFEELGKAMSLATEEHGDHPLFVLERGEITEAEFRDRIHPHLENGFDFARLRELYFEHIDPNRDMIEFIRELRGRGLRAALLTNNIREWEPLWRSKLPEIDELFEAGGRLRVRRSSQAGPGDLRAHARTARRRPPRAVRVRGRPGRELRGGARPGHGRGALRDRRAGDPGDRVSAGGE